MAFLHANIYILSFLVFQHLNISVTYEDAGNYSCAVMHNGKRWFLDHYKLSVLRKFGFNLSIHCSFVDRWVRVSKTSILQKYPLNQPRAFFQRK